MSCTPPHLLLFESCCICIEGEQITYLSKPQKARLHVLSSLMAPVLHGYAVSRMANDGQSLFNSELAPSMVIPPKRVAIIGAGVSGVVAAAHLKKEGINVTVFERSNAAGGIWQAFHPQFDFRSQLTF
jgi:NAD/NADP transhydrogenase alpha subunit